VLDTVTIIIRHEKAMCPDWINVEVLEELDFCAHVRTDPAWEDQWSANFATLQA
jgi:hypothetical protein